MLTFGTIKRQSPHSVCLVTLSDTYAVVAREIKGCFRSSIAREVGRRCTQNPSIGCDSTRDYPRFRRLAEADAHIEGVLGQRRRVDGKLQLNLDQRVLSNES